MGQPCHQIFLLKCFLAGAVMKHLSRNGPLGQHCHQNWVSRQKRFFDGADTKNLFRCSFGDQPCHQNSLLECWVAGAVIKNIFRNSFCVALSSELPAAAILRWRCHEKPFPRRFLGQPCHQTFLLKWLFAGARIKKHFPKRFMASPAIRTPC